MPRARARDGNLGIAQIQHAGVHDLRAGGARRFRNDAAVGGRNSRALPHGKQTAGIGAMRQDGGIDQLDPGIGAVRQGPYPAIAEGLDGYPVTSIRAGPLEELAFSPRPSLSWTVTVLSRNVAAPPWTTTRPRSVRRSGIADDGDIAAGHAVVATPHKNRRPQSTVEDAFTRQEHAMAIRRTVIHDDHHLVAATDKGQGDKHCAEQPRHEERRISGHEGFLVVADSCTPTTQACQAF